jgi:hypothetical protein
MEKMMVSFAISIENEAANMEASPIELGEK